VADGVSPASLPPKPGEPAQTADARTGLLVRIALLVLATVFQILSFVALFVFIHVLRGHYEGSTYSSGQRVDAAVLGLPGVALGIGVLLAAIYTLSPAAAPASSPGRPSCLSSCSRWPTGSRWR
jgi:hypothetical protein